MITRVFFLMLYIAGARPLSHYGRNNRQPAKYGYISFIAMYLCLALWDTGCTAEEYYYNAYNVTRSTISGIAAYRSSLTLDWLAAEDTGQRELAVAFETDAPSLKSISSDCMSYPRPASGKIGRLMLELLKNLEGDDGTLVSELIQVLIRSKQLVETSFLESEPDLDSLVKTPGMMMGEPHTTFPRILAVIWMLVTDPSMTRKYGWCLINKVNQYLANAKPTEVAKQMRSLELVMSRARFIMEEFIQNITPMNMYQKKPKKFKTKVPLPPHQMSFMKTSRSTESTPRFEVLDGNTIVVTNNCPNIIKLHSQAHDLDELDPEFSSEDRWMYRNSRLPDGGEPCLRIHPTSKDIIKRFQAILTYFDKDHSNTEFLHKYRATVYGMSQGEELLDREAAYYAAVLTPLVFLQNYRDTWCLLERFHRALRLFQISHPTEKRSALKLLQNFRAVNHKIRIFVLELPGAAASRARLTTPTLEFDEDEFHDKKDIQILKELIKNFG